MIYLPFEHISHKEDHHSGVHFILLTPSVPAGCRLADKAPHIVGTQNGHNQTEFDEHRQLRNVKTYTGRIIVGTLERYLGILFGHNRSVFLKRFAIST